LALALAVHWLGFALDEVFFRGYRRVTVRAPLFVLGVPRSGTTRIHATLASDPQFTTFRTWECLFALSVSARLFWRALGGIDRVLGAPGARLLRVLERKAFAALDDVHAMTLSSPEEDYFALLPILACFILVLPFPNARHLWQMGRFDRDLSPRARALTLDFYHRCLQKHLYFHGTERRLLSKNAAFAPLAHSLRERYADARFIVCVRDPDAALPSQLSSIASGLAFFGVPSASVALRERFIDQLRFYYLNLSAAFGTLPPSRCAWLRMSDLKHQLGARLEAIYAQLELPLTPAFAAALHHHDLTSRRYRSAHRYSLAQFGLDHATVAARFASVYNDPALAPLLTPRRASPVGER